jgi:hypothetical protein
MNIKAKIEKLERRLNNPCSIVRRIIRLAVGEPEPPDLPPDTLAVTTRIVTKPAAEGRRQTPGT